MTVSLVEELRQLADTDLFAEIRKANSLVGRPFHLDFEVLRLLSNDKWKQNVGGVSAGTFLLCLYEAETEVDEALLVRVLGPTKLPSDDDVVAAMVDYYKEALPTGGPGLDSYTRSEFQFSGLECRVLGAFYRDGRGKVRFGGDVDNFYAAHNYRAYKPTGKALEFIANFREDGIPGGRGDVRIGSVRYSSTRRHGNDEVPVYVSGFDFLGKRTALFGMTRTGKSNTVKKIIQATMALSAGELASDGTHLDPVGQIIFDVNGEYANANQQDEGTAIFQQYPDNVTRYSVIKKDGFRVLKLNFYRQIAEGHELLAVLLADDTADYVGAFKSIDWTVPPATDHGLTTRYHRRVACYMACLYVAGLEVPVGTRPKFDSSAELMNSGLAGLDGIDPSRGLSLDDTAAWFTAVWDHYQIAGGPFAVWKQRNGGREWADDDLQTLMRFLTRKRIAGGQAGISGYIKLIPARELHTASAARSFELDIVDLLRAGGIVIVDLSQGDPRIQRMYSDKVCWAIFRDAMKDFIENKAASFIQLYFEEAHNLFPSKEEKDLTLVYNRLAKEGQKLRLGLVYATQEVSSISGSILKNTQNWFVSHLNNEEELREIKKFYDFEDFMGSLRRTTDKGFIRMKTDSSTFVVPVQIDRFVADVK